jgi:hypothetical protein
VSRMERSSCAEETESIGGAIGTKRLVSPLFRPAAGADAGYQP